MPPVLQRISFISLVLCSSLIPESQRIPGMPTEPGSFGQISWAEKFALLGKVLCMPFALPILAIQTLLTCPKKPWKRFLSDANFRYLTSRLSIRQIQYVTGDSIAVYQKWTSKNEVQRTVEEIGDGARLLWIGNRRTDRVILYLHGGVFCLPVFDFGLSFWKYVIDCLKETKDLDIGFAVLNYTLIPSAPQKTQFKQTIRAVNHLITLGIAPHNIQLVGDSAGGALILQLLSHALHPHPEIDMLLLPPNEKFGGAYLMSPWISMKGDTGSYAANSRSDIISVRSWAHYGEQVLNSVETQDLPYVDPAAAPVGWFSGVEELIHRVLISVGEYECLKDDVVNFANTFSLEHKRTNVVVQTGGVHDDPLFDFSANLAESQLGKLTPIIVSWLVDGFHW